MIEVLRDKLSGIPGRDGQINVLREQLQVLVLKHLSDLKAFSGIAFIGGTALRILYGVRRFSEDLDFSVVNRKQYDFPRLIDGVVNCFKLWNLAVQTRVKSGIIDSCFFNFTNVLQELDLAVANNQRFSIKIEIDTNPPLGAVVEEQIVNNDFIFPVCTYNLPSLMAGKLHAVMFRKYQKGRDFYDLLWYLSRKCEPNLTLLESSILQTENKRLVLTDGKWQKLLQQKLTGLNYRRLVEDVRPFIEDSGELALITEKWLLELITRY